jgi:hypothetical protein
VVNAQHDVADVLAPFEHQFLTSRGYEGAVMPVIKARTTQKHLVRHITGLYRENNETLFAYAAFIDESPQYVLNQLVDTVLAKDREFVTWRDAHPDSYVPTPGARKRRRARPFPTANTGRSSADNPATSRT